MKTSTFLFVLAGCTLFFGSGKGAAGTFALAFMILGLASLGAFLLVNGY